MNHRAPQKKGCASFRQVRIAVKGCDLTASATLLQTRVLLDLCLIQMSEKGRDKIS
jgi:hypothetical protein